MALICIGSITGSPGVTTLSVLTAASWPRPVVLLEADPSGGVLAVRYRLGRSPGLAGLASVVRQGAPREAIWAYSQMLPGDLPVVVAPESGPVTTSILDDAAHPLASWCRDHAAVDVIVDCGRLAVRDVTWPLWAAADDLLLVTHPRADELYPVAHRFKALDRHVSSIGLVLVGDRPYRPEEVALQLGLPIRGVISDDARAASVLARGGSGRTLRRSALVRSVRSLVDTLALRLGVSVVVEEAGLPAAGQTGTHDGSGRRLGRASGKPGRAGGQSVDDRFSGRRRKGPRRVGDGAKRRSAAAPDRSKNRRPRRQSDPAARPAGLAPPPAPPPPPPPPPPAARGQRAPNGPPAAEHIGAGAPPESPPASPSWATVPTTPARGSPASPAQPPRDAGDGGGQGDLDSAIAAAEKLGSRVEELGRHPGPDRPQEPASVPSPDHAAEAAAEPGDVPVPEPVMPDDVMVDMLERTAAVLSDGASDEAVKANHDPESQPSNGEPRTEDRRPALPRRDLPPQAASGGPAAAYPGPARDPHSEPMPAASAAAAGRAASPGPGAAAGSSFEAGAGSGHSTSGGRGDE